MLTRLCALLLVAALAGCERGELLDNFGDRVTITVYCDGDRAPTVERLRVLPAP